MPPLNTVKKSQSSTSDVDHTSVHTESPKDPAARHVQIRQYSLNKTKAIQKKIEKCHADTIIEMKDSGRQMVISCSTAYYESLRRSIFQYFERINKESNTLAIVVRQVTDANGHIVEHVLRASNRLKHSGNPGQRTKFVLNMYNTNNRILANGSCLNLLIKDHLPKVLLLTEERGLDSIIEENQKLAQALTNLDGTSVGSENTASGASASLVEPTGIANKNPKADSTKVIEICECTENDKKMLCPQCNTHACMDTIECDQCKNWFHYLCANLNKDNISKYENDSSLTFTCLQCTSPSEITQPNRNQDVIQSSQNTYSKEPKLGPATCNLAASENNPETPGAEEQVPPEPSNKEAINNCRCEGSDASSTCPICNEHACLNTV